MFAFLSFLWFIRESKLILFYIYLWQLKEYRPRRFLDHFRTEKGKKLIINQINLIKIGLFLIFLVILIFQKEISRTGREGFFKFFLGVLIVFYVIEFIFALKNIFQKKLKAPVLTGKAVILVFGGAAMEIIVLFILLGSITDIFYFAFWLLLFDILTPVISSLIILLTQPITILIKNQIIKKAKIKRRGYKNLTVIGITGSCGKTSTKEFLAAILSERFKVLKTKEHQNNEMGVSQCILKELRPDHQIFICEMGAYKQGEIKLLSDITKPKIGILTGINEQHLALFGSQDNIIQTTFELIESLPEDGVAIFNGDNKYINSNAKSQIAKLHLKTQRFCSTKEKMDVWAEDIVVGEEKITFRVLAKDGDFANFEVNLLGSHNVINLLLVVSCAKELGMKLEEIAQIARNIKIEQGAIKLVKGREGLNILDSSYSANPDGVIADLDYLKIYQGKKLIVMPCLIELGSASKEVHYRIGRKIGEVCAPVKEPNGSHGTPSGLAIITTKERFEEIKKGAIEAGMKKENILFIESPDEIVAKINIFCSPGDTVLFEGRVPKELIKELRG